MQGDVLRIVNGAGTIVAKYEYDAWGKVLKVTNNAGMVQSASAFIGNINPIRYRGYYYDAETGFYYLQSRYYDPEVCRFINADEPGMIEATAGTLLSKDLFAYCENNPVNMIDTDGFAPAYINWQSKNTTIKINGKNTKMKDISFGIGNIANNGCGVIAAYNVLLSKSSKVNFLTVRNDIIKYGGLNAGGLLGVFPAAIELYLKTKFKSVFHDGPITWFWGYEVAKCDAVIVLYRPTNSLSMHYVAGIAQGKEKFIFYNTWLNSISGIAMTMRTFLQKIAQAKKLPLYLIGIKTKKGSW